MTRKQTVIVKLKRSSAGKPWGIRIAGGADLGTPIVVTRVSFLFHSIFFEQTSPDSHTCVTDAPSNRYIHTLPANKLLLDIPQSGCNRTARD